MTAGAERQRAWRARNPEVYRIARRRQTARLNAALVVAKRHPEEFEQAIRDELTKRGLK